MSWQETEVLVIGTFDIPHFGHFRFLKEARALGRVTVALGTDHHQASYKRLPVLTYWERKATLLELPWVDQVVMRDKPNTKDIVATHTPMYLPYGSDWSAGDFLAINELSFQYIDNYGIILVRLVRDGEMSSSKIIQRIKEQ